ncbi:MAG: TRAP transporter large permease subunit [candidate division KSB1 bacterium]|nr:TRAP transporter large permease subunit [candidate division KSB1 bacterium]
MTTILWAVFLILLALLGAPLFSIIGAIALLSFHFLGIDTSAVIVEMYRLSSAPTLIAIPLFTFAGYVLAESNAPKRLVNLSRAMFGWMPGGLAIVVLVTCAFFTAFTGASGVTIVAIGGLLYPMLLKEGYPEKFSLGLITSSGSLGLLFPPSLPIILYAVVAKISVDQLFLAGIIPGFLLIILLSIYSTQKGKKAAVPVTRFNWGNLWLALKEAIWEIPLPFIIIGGIYGGFFTATEAAAITAFYALIVEVFVYQDLKLFKDIPKIIKESTVLVGGILVILGTALGLTNYLIDEQVPMKILNFMQTFISSKIVFLIMLNILLLIVGCMMDIFSAIIVVVPLIVPIARAFGVDPIHLGVIFLTNLEIGYLTPPVGLNLFISSFRFEKPILQLYRASLPFLLILIIALFIITYIPALSLGLLRLVGK